jgi:hypothetical protein
MSNQILMRFDPVTGIEKPYPSSAEQYRQYHGKVAWLFNPYTGTARDPRDIGSDVLGHLIHAQKDGDLIRYENSTYYFFEKTSHDAEECECAMKFLDDQGTPRVDGLGNVFSLVGRIKFYASQK